MQKLKQTAIRILFLALFTLLLSLGKPQVWMILFVLSLVGSFLLGRVYCGWFCPISTIMSVITAIKKKLHLKSRTVPALLLKPWVRVASVGIFMALFVFTLVSGKKLPVLLAFLVVGAALTLFFPEELWHRYLCPYGLILSFPSSKAKHAMTVDSVLCNNCGTCKRVCPAQAVVKKEKHEIITKDCLVCMECARSCKQEAIHFI